MTQLSNPATFTPAASPQDFLGVEAWIERPEPNGPPNYAATLPYGKWTCADGREVLFNRWYGPIWERSAAGVVRRANPGEWVQFERVEWFYTDGNSPRRSPKTVRRCVAVLKSWGVEY
jgi:hypothetical protein